MPGVKAATAVVASVRAGTEEQETQFLKRTETRAPYSLAPTRRALVLRLSHWIALNSAGKKKASAGSNLNGVGTYRRLPRWAYVRLSLDLACAFEHTKTIESCLDLRSWKSGEREVVRTVGGVRRKVEADRRRGLTVPST